MQLYGGCSKVAKSKDARCGVVVWWWCGGGGVVFITDNNSTEGLHWGYLVCGNSDKYVLASLTIQDMAINFKIIKMIVKTCLVTRNKIICFCYN